MKKLFRTISALISQKISVKKLFLLISGLAIITGVPLVLPCVSKVQFKNTVADTTIEVRTKLKDSVSETKTFKTTTIKNQIIIHKLFDSASIMGKNVLITAGGYGAKLSWVEEWTKELYRSKLKEYNIGIIYVVPGPKEAYYDSREIPIGELARNLVEAYSKYKLDKTYVIAHSSGVFPAHQLFDLLYIGKPAEAAKNDSLTKKKETKHKKKKGESLKGNDKNSKLTKVPAKLIPIDAAGITKNKIIYIMLDGEPGIPRGYTLTKTMAESLRKIISVYAIDSTTNTKSGMYAEAVKIKKLFPEKTVDYLITSKKSGCAKGAKWCVHETLITTKPHNPKMYDLQNDYQFFDKERYVVTEFMKAVDDMEKPKQDSVKAK